jgi:hypothetical protein
LRATSEAFASASRGRGFLLDEKQNGHASLFGRLDRFAPTELRDPGEERLTEAFAATLEAAPELAETLVERSSKRSRDGGN